MNARKTEQGFKKINEACPYHCTNGRVFIPDKGLVPCPRCAGIQGYAERMDDTNPNNVFEVLKIPSLYRKCDGNTALMYIEEVRAFYKEKGANVTQYCNALSELYNAISYGSLFKCSLLIRELPTAKLDINKFVYGVMFEALMKGVGVLPYISVSWLNVLRCGEDIKEGSSFSNMPIRKYQIDGITGMSTSLMIRCKCAYNIDYYDYMLAPLVFIDINTSAKPDELSTLQNIITERARRELPTYVTVNPRAGGISVDDLAEGLFDCMLTTSNYRLDRLVPLDIYTTAGKTMKDVDKLMGYVPKDNIGTVDNSFGLRVYNNELITKENDNG